MKFDQVLEPITNEKSKVPIVRKFKKKIFYKRKRKAIKPIVQENFDEDSDNNDNAFMNDSDHDDGNDGDDDVNSNIANGDVLDDYDKKCNYESDDEKDSVDDDIYDFEDKLDDNDDVNVDDVAVGVDDNNDDDDNIKSKIKESSYFNDSHIVLRIKSENLKVNSKEHVRILHFENPSSFWIRRCCDYIRINNLTNDLAAYVFETNVNEEFINLSIGMCNILKI